MRRRLAIIGFGEAGASLAGAAGWEAGVFDIATNDPNRVVAKRAEYAVVGVTGHASPGEAVANAEIILCLVTADQALAAASACAPYLAPGALWCDMNSVAPDTKRAAAASITAAGARYLDVAIMAPVQPSMLDVPLLLAGPDAGPDAGDAALASLGFTRRRIIGPTIGDAATIKMLRSVIVKGQEALTAECLAGAVRAGLVDQVVTAFGHDWPAHADYHLDRMLVHGARRAAEMDEVVATLASLGVEPRLSRATADWQRAVGQGRAPDGFAAKLEALA